MDSMSKAHVSATCACGARVDFNGDVAWVNVQYERFLERHDKCIEPREGYYIKTPKETFNKHRVSTEDLIEQAKKSAQEFLKGWIS